MPRQASNIDMDRWVKIQKALTRALRGESVSVDEACLPAPDYACHFCQDTGFVVEKRFDGTFHGRRCETCKTHIDAETKKNAKYPAIEREIPDAAPPREFDWKQAAGFDGIED